MPQEWDIEARLRLAKVVCARRMELRLSQKEAAALGDLSVVPWARVEAAKAVRGLTYSGVESALEWESGSVEAILTGGRPTVLAGSSRRDGCDRRKNAPLTPEEAIELDPTLTHDAKDVIVIVIRHIRNASRT